MSPFSLEEREHGRRVMDLVRQYVREDRPIRLPRPAALESGVDRAYALMAIAPNEFSGSAGEFVYQFEGEDDLLHLMICRNDGEKLSVEEARRLAEVLLDGVEPGLVWLRPGTVSQHFYVGHDDLTK